MRGKRRGVAQSGLAHLHGVQGVAGSNPVAPTKFRGACGTERMLRVAEDYNVCCDSGSIGYCGFL